MKSNSDLFQNVYGLTGGIASGKSTVAQLLLNLGFSVIDADQISRDVSKEGGRAASLILKEFGTLDRATLRKIVFENQELRKKLENILHPIIREESEKKIAELVARNPSQPIIYEAALLIEAGRAKDFKGLIVVTAPEETRIRRLMTRDQIDKGLAESILKAQISDQERCKHATHRVENAGTENDLREAVKKLAHQILAR